MSSAERFVMISDSRLGRTSSGQIGTSNPGLLGDGWKRGLMLPEMTFAARVDPHLGSASAPMDVSVSPLPYYIGLRQFFRELPRTWITIFRLVRSNDVTISRVPGLVGVLTVASAVITSRPLALEVVGDPRDSLMGSRVRDRVLSSVGALVTRWAVRQADAVRYVTQRTLQSSFPAKEGAASIAFSSVQSAAWFTTPKGQESPDPRIVAVGSQDMMYKGHDLLIRALPEIRRRVPGTVLSLIGDGRLQGQLRALAVEMRVGPHVEFVGHLSERREVIERVDSAWVFAMPSRTEGLPRALVEAMARGKACVATRVGGIPELLAEESLVDAEDVPGLVDEISKLLVNDSLRKSRGIDSLKRAGIFHPQELEVRAGEWANAVRRLR